MLLLLVLAVTAHTAVKAQLLYEISGNGLKQRSYLFAQYPLTDVSFLDSIPNLLKAYGRSEALVLETAFNNIDAQEAIAMAASMPDSINYGDLLTTTQYELLDRTLYERTHLTLEQLGRIRPVALGQMLLEQLYARNMRYDERRSAENFFQKVASQQNHPIIGLDNREEALHILFSREPIEHQAQDLMNLITNPERELAQARELIRLYRDGRLTEMVYTIRTPENRTFISYSDYLAYSRRNTRWAEQLSVLMQQQSCFVALNAIYLGGDDGLIQKLRRAGYKVKAASK